MKKIIAILLALIVIGGIGWFILLRPEQISQEHLTEAFETNIQAYQDIASYLTKRNITTEIDNIPLAGKGYAGVKNDDSDEYRAFMEALYVIMESDHDLIVSDGQTVEFIYHSTGGKLNAISGSLIYTTEDSPAHTETVPLPQKGWYLRLAK